MFQNVVVKGLYERIGGDVITHAAVGVFHQKLLKDSLLAPVFNALDQDDQEAACHRFISYAFDGSDAENAKDMLGLPTSHADLLEDQHFDRMMKHFGETLVALKVPAYLIREAAIIAESARKDILGK